MGSCCCSSYGWLLSVVMCIASGGKEKRGHIMLPNKCCLLSITNKQQTNKQFQQNSIPAYSREHTGVNSRIQQNSIRMENTRINGLEGPSAKFHSTGMIGFLQEQGGTANTSQNHVAKTARTSIELCNVIILVYTLSTSTL